jgi:hypothetical protein
VTPVTIFSVNECSGLGDLAAVSGDAIATLTTNPAVQAELAAQGKLGSEIMGYTLDGDSLTVYVRDRS